MVAARIEGMAAKDLRAAVDTLKSRLGDAVIVLAAAADGKVSLSGAALAKVKAGDLLAHVAGRIGGKGGGRADLAQGGGPDHPALPEALDEVADWVGRHAV